MIAATPLADFHARVTFSDGTEREIDLRLYFNTGGVFGAVRSDPAFFALLTVEHDTLTWPNGADIDPDVLYLGLRPNASRHE